MKKTRKTNKIAETFNASSLLFDRLERYLSSSFSPALTFASVSSTLSSILQRNNRNQREVSSRHQQQHQQQPTTPPSDAPSHEIFLLVENRREPPEHLPDVHDVALDLRDCFRARLSVILLLRHDLLLRHRRDQRYDLAVRALDAVRSWQRVRQVYLAAAADPVAGTRRRWRAVGRKRQRLAQRARRRLAVPRAPVLLQLHVLLPDLEDVLEALGRRHQAGLHERHDRVRVRRSLSRAVRRSLAIDVFLLASRVPTSVREHTR